MKTEYKAILDDIVTQREAMIALVTRWAEINSGSRNLNGLAAMQKELVEAFAVLGGEVSLGELSPQQIVDDKGRLFSQELGKVIHIRKRPNAPKRLYLGGHYDTVYAPDHPFQKTQWLDDMTLNGPGVADLKGGLVVMLHALMAFEKSPNSEQIGWEILLNPDEEIGSPGSAPLLTEAAKRNHLGLVFEPALPDGKLAGARKGSGNFTVVMHGRSAHAGRGPEQGRNAIVALSEYVQKLYALNGKREGLTINPGVISGGTTVNTVPDQAILRFNVRVGQPDDTAWFEAQLDELAKQFVSRDGFRHTIYGGFSRPPKPLEKNLPLFEEIKACGSELGQEIDWYATGGVCDGNNLSAAGLPNVDSLGVRGGNLHTDQEYMKVDSLVERAQLAALFMMKYANEELKNF
jgi:glutamate carboxypeptidase